MAAKQKKNKKKSSAKRPTRHIPCDSIIFDIDNVLIDTRASYLEAIRVTVEIYLTEGKIPLFISDMGPKKGALLTMEDIHQFKLLGGFNDDWDCCYGLLTYLLSLKVKKRTLEELRKQINVPKFVKSVKKRPLGVSGITKLLERNKAVTIEKISRIFQEVYLGRDLYAALENRNTIYWKKRGLIQKEKLIFKRKALEKLRHAGFELSIATGRPRFEALFALKQFHVIDLFDAMTTADDVKKAEKSAKKSLRKPHPFSLLQTAKKMGAKKNFVYVGDLPDDVLAANAAKKEINISSIAFPTYSGDSSVAIQEIQKAQPDMTIKKPGDLVKMIKKI